MKKILIGVVAIIVVLIGLYVYNQKPSDEVIVKDDTKPTVPAKPTMATTTKTDQGKSPESVIGKSVENRDIVAFNFGTGDKKLLFIGGIHGGYSWNTVSVAYELIDYLKQNPSAIPANVQITVIPVLNPDGLYKVVGKTDRFMTSDVNKSTDVVTSGRFNANNVDLNRNFDCDWQASGKWQSKTVSGGRSAFSEPEAQALKTYIENNKPTAVIVWYSAAGGVFASSCHDGVLAETKELTKIFANASKYPAYEEFDFYEITGDAVNWLAKEKIPAISILLTNHTNTEWDKNLSGIKAILGYYAK